MIDIELIESFGKLSVDKDDVVVVKTQMHISFAQMVNIQEHVTSLMPHSNKVLVLSHGMDIGIVNKVDSSARCEGTSDH